MRLIGVILSIALVLSLACTSCCVPNMFNDRGGNTDETFDPNNPQ
jgi:hypothetical protein